jgi:hypothetical protein
MSRRSISAALSHLLAIHPVSGFPMQKHALTPSVSTGASSLGADDLNFGIARRMLPLTRICVLAPPILLGADTKPSRSDQCPTS